MCDISKNYNVMVFGSNGWIGNKVVKLLESMNINFVKAKSRADNYEEVEAEIIEYNNITHIYSFIGRTHGVYENTKITTIDYLEKPGKLKENVNDNLYGPFCLAMLADKYDIHYTYLGTGCIFNMDTNSNDLVGYDEESLPDFFGSGYSTVKGFTDRMMHLFKNVLNVRIRMPITDEVNERNFITKITNYKKICSIPNSMTVLDELLPIMIDLSLRYKLGTYNLTNPGLISHNEILEMYKEIVDPTFRWENFTIDEQNLILASKRSNNYLDTEKLESMYPELLNIKDSIRNVLIRMSKNVKMNLLVTGGCGFIGSNFINYYFHKNPNVNIINIDAMYYCANENNILKEIRESTRYTLVKGNLCSYDLIKYILETYNITTVIHFAAQSHVQNSFEDALQYTQDNILGTHTLLEACRKYKKITKFIHVSTDEVYGESLVNDTEMKKTESTILCPTNPYAATKAGAEMLVISYYHSFKMPIIITRGNNVYGPNQYPEKLIPRFIKQLKENEKVTIQGSGSNLRSFLHVLDVARAFECILNNGVIGETYNIGADENVEYSVMQIAHKLIKLIKNSENFNEWITYIEDRPFNDIRYYISNDKLKSLGWTINVDFEEGLRELTL
jgi:dTDP-glucose 4,6-dehydratase